MLALAVFLACLTPILLLTAALHSAHLKLKDIQRILEATKKSPPPVPTQELKDFLHDLTQGGGLVRVARLDPDNFLVRSPRDRNG